MKYKNYGKKLKSNRSTLIFGMLFNTATFFILVLIASIIILSLKNPLGASGAAAFCVLFMTGALSGFFTAKYNGGKGVFCSGLCSIIFALIIFGAGLILCGGRVMGVTVINLISYVAISFIFAMLATKEKKRKIRR